MLKLTDRLGRLQATSTTVWSLVIIGSDSPPKAAAQRSAAGAPLLRLSGGRLAPRRERRLGVAR